MQRNTKIVATLGPATSSPEMIAHLVKAGMDVARLNFSHGTHQEHRRVIDLVRQTSQAAGRTVGILQDLAGPKIRLGILPGGPWDLTTGQELTLVSGKEAPAGLVPVDYPSLEQDVAPGHRILLADGLVELEVKALQGQKVVCRVVVGGTISSHKGVNLPTGGRQVPTFTEKDRADLAVGLEAGVDFVALSFVRHERDLDQVREILAQRSQPPLLIAKIEKPQALERLEQILAVVDGVMVARGDLGVEVPLEKVPVIQKRIIGLARRLGKPVITATQMLRSMINSPRPTRAEAADVANAILDGSDAVMLSEETAVGAYPVQALSMLDRIARATEPTLNFRHYLEEPAPHLLAAAEGAISRAACLLAEDLGAAAIVAATTSGSTPRLVARLRPPCPVVGLASHPRVQRQLTLSWGVLPALSPPIKSTDQIFELAEQWVRQNSLAGPGDRLVITAGVPLGVPGTTNLLKVMQI